MRYFATVCGAESETQVEKKVLASNPIMEVLLTCRLCVFRVVDRQDFVVVLAGDRQRKDDAQRQQFALREVHRDWLQQARPDRRRQHAHVPAREVAV